MKSKGKIIYIANNVRVYGGTLVLSALCATLRKLGYDARLIIRDYPVYGTPQSYMHVYTNLKRFVFLSLLKMGLLPKKFLKSHPTTVTIPGLKDMLKYTMFSPADKDAIIVYPETVWGNPHGMKNVVRWLLYHHRYYEGKDTYGENDCFVAYREVFNDEKLNPGKIIFHMNYFDNKLYRQYNFGPREGNCYILRKGRHRRDLPKEFDGPVFDDNMSDEAFVEILNRCKYCYSYDTQSFYNSIARICGCIPIVVLEPGKTESDYVTSEEKHYGVAYGDTPEQIEHALSTTDKLLKRLDYEESNKATALRFVEYLESKFGKIRRI